jgi:hypothetical protein
MTQAPPTSPAAPTAVVHARASLDVRAIVLPRAQWDVLPTPEGRGGLAFRPQKGTWYGHIVRGRSRLDTTVLAMIGCPACGGVLLLSQSEDAARALRKLTGLPVPVAHAIDRLGKVTPDVLCKHGRCDFHRKVYLDRWNKTKPLYAIAYVNLEKSEHGAIEIAYSHALSAAEARLHLGQGSFKVIGAGPAIGFFVNEKTGRVTAD